MLKNFKWYRKWKGGEWMYVFWSCHYLHGSYYEWIQDKALLEFPWHAQLVKREEYKK